MSTLKVKTFLWRNQLTLAGMARDLATKTATQDSVRVMLSQMVNGVRFYPALARRVERKYGLKLTDSTGKARAA